MAVPVSEKRSELVRVGAVCQPSTPHSASHICATSAVALPFFTLHPLSRPSRVPVHPTRPLSAQIALPKPQFCSLDCDRDLPVPFFS